VAFNLAADLLYSLLDPRVPMRSPSLLFGSFLVGLFLLMALASSIYPVDPNAPISWPASSPPRPSTPWARTLWAATFWPASSSGPKTPSW
jgi:hypothetical protein